MDIVGSLELPLFHHISSSSSKAASLGAELVKEAAALATTVKEQVVNALHSSHSSWKWNGMFQEMRRSRRMSSMLG